MDGDQITLRRMRIECEASGGRAAEHGLQRLEQVARNVLPEMLAGFMRTALPAGWQGEGVSVFVPRIQITLDIDIDADPAQIARAWAKAVTLSLVEAGQEARALCLDNPTQTLAAFLADLIAGRAWQLWYWHDFQGVKPLGLSAAVRTVLMRDPEVGLAAIRAMHPADRARLCTLLSVPDARRVLRGVVGDPRADASAPDLAAFARHAVSWIAEAPLAARSSTMHMALALIVQRPEARASATRIGAATAAAVIETAEAMRGGAGAPAGAAPRPARALPNDASGARAPIIRRAVREASKAAQDIERQASDVESDAALHTPFGGVFLLWPHILALPGAWDDAGRLQVAARALGTALKPAVCGDATLRLLTDQTLKDAEAVRPDLPQDAAEAWAAAEGAHAAQWLRLPDDGLWLLRSRPHGYWLRIAERCGTAQLPEEAAPKGKTTDAADWKALSRPGPEDAIGQAAQIVLRRCAYRIPGFATSSVGFLRANLLSMDATVQAEGVALDVALGPVPLAVMLNLTGMARQSYALADGRVVRLSMPEDAR